MDNFVASDLGIEIDEQRRQVLVDDDSLSFSEIRQIIVNRDSNGRDLIAGAVVIQTMPGDANVLTAKAPRVYERIFEGETSDEVLRHVNALKSLSEDLHRAEGQGLKVTDTNLPQDLFHRAFAEID